MLPALLPRPSPSRSAAIGRPCPYCRRTMARDHWALRPTFDHVVPRSRGGREKIICCLQCNAIKGDMMPDEWAAFMGKVPRWWELTARERRALARGEREQARTAKWGPRKKQGSPRPEPVVVPPELVYGAPGGAGD